MVAANGIHHNGSNGVHAQLYAPCASDYEPAPVIDVTPAPAPKPGWRDQFPTYTHNLSWIDSDGCSHSMTLRSDSLSDLMGDLKLLKNMIKAAKQKASESTPQQATHDPQVPGADVPDVQECRIHKVDMVRRWSKRTQGHYFGHKLPNGDFCYGRAPKA